MGPAKGTFDWVDTSRRRFGFLAAAVFAGSAILPIPTVAAVLRCASHSLTREEIARVEAVARADLPASGRLDVTFAYWNPGVAAAQLATRKSRTREGAQQWWAVSCQRNESTWTCDPAEFKQFMSVELPGGDQSHAVALSFGKGIPHARARSLASRALSIYLNPASRLPDCGTGVESGTRPVAPYRTDTRASAAEPFHVTVSRDGLTDSVALEDVEVNISFDATSNPVGEQSPCWESVVVVD